MSSSPAELARSAIPLWYANVAWAKELLVRSFNLTDPQDILQSPNRRTQQVPNTCWFVRPHGIGVHIFKAPESGGVDFDFDKPHPDEWRLAMFIEAQVNDGQLPYALYRELIQDEEVMKSAVKEALHGI